MMLTLFFVLPLLVAILCLALDRLVDTRVLGFTGAAALLVCAGLLFGARANNTLGLIDQQWLTVEDQSIRLALGYDAASWGFAVLVSAGGSLALLALALALPRTLRGYGGLVATLLLLLEATLLGLAVGDALLLPVVWAALPILAFTALRASGGQNEAQTLPAGLLGNLLGAVLLVGAMLSVRFSEGGVVPDIALFGLLVAGMLALGLPPFHRSIGDAAQAPANVAAPLLAFGLPLIAACTLTRFVAETGLSAPWATTFQLVGLATIIISGASALRERRLRRILSWHVSAQFGLLLIVLGMNRLVAITTAPAFLLNITLGIAVGLLAIGLIERRAGSDSLDEIKLGAPLLLPGVGLLVAATSMIGVPGTLGFWLLRSLFVELSAQTPLLIGPMLAGLALLACSWLAPLAAFLRVAKPNAESGRGAPLLAWLCPLIGALPLVMFGVAPGLLWNNWAEGASLALLGRSQIVDALAQPFPLDDSIDIPSLVALGTMIFATVLFRRIAVRRTLQTADAEPSGVITPDGLGESLRGVSWFGAPSVTFAQLWRGIEAASRRLGWALSFFEQRYFMAGLMLAVVAVILLLMQG